MLFEKKMYCMREKRTHDINMTPPVKAEAKKTRKKLVRTGKFSRKLYTEDEIKLNMKEYLAEWRAARPGWNREACRKWNKKKALERSKALSGGDGGQATHTENTENGKRKTEKTET